MTSAPRTDDERALLRATLDAAIDPQVYLAAVRDDEGRIVDFVYADANPAAADYMQMSRDELVGATLLQLLPGQASSGMLAMYADAVESGGPLVLDDYTYPHEILQSERRYDIRGVKVGDGLSFSWRDVTERHMMIEQLRSSEERYRMMTDNSSDVVMQIGLDGVIQWASPASRSLLGRDPDELVGCHNADLIEQGFRDRFMSEVRRIVATGETSRLRYPCLRADGSSVWVETVGDLVRDSDGQPLFRVVNMRDIDATYRAEEELQRTRDRLKALTDSLLDPVIAVTAVRSSEGSVTEFICEEANEAACHEFRRPRGDVVGQPVQDLFVHRHAGALVSDWCDQALRTKLPVAEDEVTMTGESFAEPWRFDIRAVPFGDSVSFLWREVTHRYLATQRLAASEEHYRLMAENVADVVMLMRAGIISWVSPSLVGALGWPPEQWERHRLDEFAHPDDAHVLADALPLGVTRVRLRDQGGDHHWIEMNASPFAGADGEVKGTMVSFRVADAQVEAEHKLTYQASHDPLTGLLNRETAYASFSTWLADHRVGTRMLLAFCDVDDLKSVNDRYGHLAGDRLLEGIARRVRSFLRTEDLVARIGGDEILIVMRGVHDISDGLMVLERMLLVVDEPLNVDAVQIRPRMSIGLTECVPGESAETTVARADAAMYEAKAAGGNCIHVAEVSPVAS